MYQNYNSLSIAVKKLCAIENWIMTTSGVSEVQNMTSATCVSALSLQNAFFSICSTVREVIEDLIRSNCRVSSMLQYLQCIFSDFALENSIVY